MCVSTCVTVYLELCHLREHWECWGTWLCACKIVCACALCMGAGRRCRLLPAFSTHSASPQVACCEMSVAEKLKISPLLLLLTAWADGAVGPQQAPWAQRGRRNCWIRGGYGVRKVSTLTPCFPPGLQSEAPGSLLSGSPQGPPRSCHVLVCACVSVCGVQSCLRGSDGLHQTGAHLGSASSASLGTPEDRTSDKGLLGMGCIFSLSLRALWCCFFPRTKGQGCNPGCMGSPGTGSWGH